MEYATNAKANTAVTLGAIGTGLGVLGSGMGLLGGAHPAGNIEDRHISRYELDLMRQLDAEKSANAILQSEKYTDQKLVEVYTALAKQDKEINAKIDANIRDQAVYNGVNTATVTCMKNQIEQLMGLTALRIPNTSVCPGWGAVEVTPVTPTP